MKCEKCKKNEATVFYREIINGKETKYVLCPECAAEYETESAPFTPFAPFAGELLSGFFSPLSPKVRREEKKCTLCGSTFREICESSKAGCPVCYSVFREELSPTLMKLHGNTAHRGRVPERFRKEAEIKNEKAELEKKLKEAIASEKYEDAAVIRDKLRSMKGSE